MSDAWNWAGGAANSVGNWMGGAANTVGQGLGLDFSGAMDPHSAAPTVDYSQAQQGQGALNQNNANTYGLANSYNAGVLTGKQPSASQLAGQAQTKQMTSANDALANSAKGTAGGGNAAKNAMSANASGSAQIAGNTAAGTAAEKATAAGGLGTSGYEQGGQNLQQQSLNMQQAMTPAQIAMANRSQNMAANQQNVQNVGNLMSMGGSAIGGLAMLSDANAKTGIQAADADLQEPPNRSDPGDEAHLSLREEPSVDGKPFLLTFDHQTGRAYKAAMQPLSPEEEKVAFDRPHGAGEFGSPDRQRTEVGDLKFGDYTINDQGEEVPSGYGGATAVDTPNNLHERSMGGLGLSVPGGADHVGPLGSQAREGMGPRPDLPSKMPEKGKPSNTSPRMPEYSATAAPEDVGSQEAQDRWAQNFTKNWNEPEYNSEELGYSPSFPSDWDKAERGLEYAQGHVGPDESLQYPDSAPTEASGVAPQQAAPPIKSRIQPWVAPNGHAAEDTSQKSAADAAARKKKGAEMLQNMRPEGGEGGSRGPDFNAYRQFAPNGGRLEVHDLDMGSDEKDPFSSSDDPFYQPPNPPPPPKSSSGGMSSMMGAMGGGGSGGAGGGIAAADMDMGGFKNPFMPSSSSSSSSSPPGANGAQQTAGSMGGGMGGSKGGGVGGSRSMYSDAFGSGGGLMAADADLGPDVKTALHRVKSQKTTQPPASADEWGSMDQDVRGKDKPWTETHPREVSGPGTSDNVPQSGETWLPKGVWGDTRDDVSDPMRQYNSPTFPEIIDDPPSADDQFQMPDRHSGQPDVEKSHSTYTNADLDLGNTHSYADRVRGHIEAADADLGNGASVREREPVSITRTHKMGGGTASSSIDPTNTRHAPVEEGGKPDVMYGPDGKRWVLQPDGNYAPAGPAPREPIGAARITPGPGGVQQTQRFDPNVQPAHSVSPPQQAAQQAAQATRAVTGVVDQQVANQMAQKAAQQAVAQSIQKVPNAAAAASAPIQGSDIDLNSKKKNLNGDAVNPEGIRPTGTDPGVAAITSDKMKKTDIKKLGESTNHGGPRDTEANADRSTSDTGDRGGAEQREAKRSDSTSGRRDGNTQHTPSKRDESGYGASPKHEMKHGDYYGAKNPSLGNGVQGSAAWYEPLFKGDPAVTRGADPWGHPGATEDRIHASDLDMGSHMQKSGQALNMPQSRGFADDDFSAVQHGGGGGYRYVWDPGSSRNDRELTSREMGRDHNEFTRSFADMDLKPTMGPTYGADVDMRPVGVRQPPQDRSPSGDVPMGLGAAHKPPPRTGLGFLERKRSMR